MLANVHLLIWKHLHVHNAHSLSWWLINETLQLGVNQFFQFFRELIVRQWTEFVVHTPYYLFKNPHTDFSERVRSWELLSIRWQWDVSPPPPPPATLTLYQELLEADPRGYELGRKTMDELYPDLRYIATASVGGSVGRFPVDREVRNTVSFTHVAFKTHR